jgi:hypothetical protein
MSLWRALDKALAEQVAGAEGYVTEGACKDWADYRAKTARVQAFKEAKAIVRETIETYGLEEAEDDDEQ